MHERVPYAERQERYLQAPFRWTPQQRLAVQGLASGETARTVAAEVGCSVRSLVLWQRHPEFADALRGALAEQQQAVGQWAVLVRSRRLECLAERHALLGQVIAERAAAYAGAAPGTGTGLMWPDARLVKVVEDETPPETTAEGEPVVKSARRYVTVQSWRVDVATLRELRDLERQAAVELGEWTEKHEHGLDAVELDTYIAHELARLAHPEKDRAAGAADRPA